MSEIEFKDGFISILKQEQAVYKKLLGLAKEKTEALVKNNIERIKKITESMNTQLEKIDDLERERKALIKKISKIENVPPDKIDLSFLSSLWQEPDLEKLKNDFKNLLTDLKGITQRNTLLINQAKDTLSFLRDLFYSSLEYSIGYNAQGRIEKTKPEERFHREV